MGSSHGTTRPSPRYCVRYVRTQIPKPDDLLKGVQLWEKRCVCPWRPVLVLSTNHTLNIILLAGGARSHAQHQGMYRCSQSALTTCLPTSSVTLRGGTTQASHLNPTLADLQGPTACLLLADPYEMLPNGDIRLIDLFIRLPSKPGELTAYRCIRGTNVVENYFNAFHHSVLAGNNNTPEHAQLLFDVHNLQ